jgi:hypothetical protein
LKYFDLLSPLLECFAEHHMQILHRLHVHSGGASPKYWGGPQKIILIYKLNMQIILYAKYSNYNKHILDYKKNKN